MSMDFHEVIRNYPPTTHFTFAQRSLAMANVPSAILCHGFSIFARNNHTHSFRPQTDIAAISNTILFNAAVKTNNLKLLVEKVLPNQQNFHNSTECQTTNMLVLTILTNKKNKPTHTHSRFTQDIQCSDLRKLYSFNIYIFSLHSITAIQPPCSIHGHINLHISSPYPCFQQQLLFGIQSGQADIDTLYNKRIKWQLLRGSHQGLLRIINIHPLEQSTYKGAEVTNKSVTRDMQNHSDYK